MHLALSGQSIRSQELRGAEAFELPVAGMVIEASILYGSRRRCDHEACPTRANALRDTDLVAGMDET
jgi:hypothetical protein